MKVRKTTWVESENCPGALVVAMMEAKVPGDAKIIEMKTNTINADFDIYSDRYWSQASAVTIEQVKFLFEWYREEDREGTIVVPDYTRRMIA